MPSALLVAEMMLLVDCFMTGIPMVELKELTLLSRLRGLLEE